MKHKLKLKGKYISKPEKDIIDLIRKKKTPTMREIYRACSYPYPELDAIFIKLMQKDIIQPKIFGGRRVWSLEV